MDPMYYILADLLSFPNSPTQLLAYSTRTFLCFRSFSPSLSLTEYMYTYLRTDTHRISITCCRKKMTYAYVHLCILVCVVPLKIPQTIGSMLNVFLFFMYNIMVVTSVVCNLVSDTCVAFSKPSFEDYNSLDLSPPFSLHFVCFFSPVVCRIKRTFFNDSTRRVGFSFCEKLRASNELIT